ncbi:MAG: hypothetical protein R3B82_13305 [Sandaracinaceae bacterium]
MKPSADAIVAAAEGPHPAEEAMRAIREPVFHDLGSFGVIERRIEQREGAVRRPLARPPQQRATDPGSSPALEQAPDPLAEHGQDRRSRHTTGRTRSTTSTTTRDQHGELSCVEEAQEGLVGHAADDFAHGSSGDRSPRSRGCSGSGCRRRSAERPSIRISSSWMTRSGRQDD